MIGDTRSGSSRRSTRGRTTAATIAPTTYSAVEFHTRSDPRRIAPDGARAAPGDLADLSGGRDRHDEREIFFSAFGDARAQEWERSQDYNYQQLDRVTKRAADWGKVDRLITATAAVIPWFWDKQPNIQSKGVQGVIAQWNADWDLSYTSLK